MNIIEPEKKPRKSGELRFYLILACAMLAFMIFIQPIRVQGSSMECTLYNGDILLMIRDWVVDEYEAGDIVVASKEQFNNGEFIIKRIVAVEGQVVDIDDETGHVYVDGVALDEPYASTLTYANGEMNFPLTVEDDCFFVLGDNREDSLDSRDLEIGQIHITEMQGKIVFLLFPGMFENQVDVGRVGSVD